jgi:AcrR family transcriptional regulator
MVNATVELEKPIAPRAARHERQRRITRQRLLAAAVEVFVEQGYLRTTVEDILVRAAVSRATFYAHFDDKLAVMRTVAAEAGPAWRPLFDELGDSSAWTREAFADWASRLIALYRRRGALSVLVNSVAATEGAVFATLAEQRRALIASLAERAPAFQRAMESPGGHLRADLMLQSLDLACYHVACRDIEAGAEAAADVVAEIVIGFLGVKLHADNVPASPSTPAIGT